MTALTLNDELWMLSDALQDLARTAFEEVRREHPLLNRLPVFEGAARWVEISADVQTQQLAIARYRIPRVGLTSRYTLPDSLRSEALCRWACDVIHDITELYRRDVIRRLYRSTGDVLGLDGLAPRTVGTNVVGSLSEATLPGWRSRAIATRRTDATPRPTYQALVSLSSSTWRRGAQQVVLVGQRIFREIFERATSFFVSSADPRLIAFNRGFLYCDPYCDPDEAFVVPTKDLRLYSSPPAVDMMQVPGTPLVMMSMRSAEQLIAERRYSLGRLVSSPANDMRRSQSAR